MNRRARLGAAALMAAALVAAVLVTTPATAAQLRVPVAEARMLNYYPVGHGWAAMWTAWDAAEFDRDMGKVAGLGANAVRLILQPQAFGYPTPSGQMLARLDQAVGIADAHGLAVELTLFDWFSSFSDLNGSKRWADAIVGPYAEDPRIWAVELQNEIAIDNPAAVSWARTMLPHVDALTTAPTTISVNGGPARVGQLKAALGPVRPAFWSYHYYDQVLGAGAHDSFAKAKALAAPEALYIGETGVDTELRVGEDKAAAWARQDHFFRTVFTAARAQGLPVPAPWTLSDFAAGSYPGRQWAGQYSFGLFATDWTPKPAAATVQQAFAGAPMSTAINGSFENSSSAVPAEWTQYLPSLTNFAVDATTAHSGSRSVRFWSSLGDATGWPSVRTTPVQPIVAGRTYTATAWAKGANATGNNVVTIGWYAADGRYLGGSASPALKTGNTDWTQLTATGVAPAQAAAALLHLQTTRNTGSVWFDDVTFG